MAFCEECGARLPENAAVCPACGAAVKGAAPSAATEAANKAVFQMDKPENDMANKAKDALNGGVAAISKGMGKAKDQLGDMHKQRMSTVTNNNTSMTLADGEKIVRQYQCAKIMSPRAKGYLTVTNKRMIFHASSATSRISKEIVLDSVTGLNCYSGMNINLFTMIFAIIIGLAGLSRLFTSYSNKLPALIFVIMAVIIGYFSFRPSFKLSVYSSKANGTPISLGEGAQSLLGNGALYTLVSQPTADTNRMLNELGALVQDLQTMGDHAIEKWS